MTKLFKLELTVYSNLNHVKKTLSYFDDLITSLKKLKFSGKESNNVKAIKKYLPKNFLARNLFWKMNMEYLLDQLKIIFFSWKLYYKLLPEKCIEQHSIHRNLKSSINNIHYIRFWILNIERKYFYLCWNFENIYIINYKYARLT